MALSNLWLSGGKGRVSQLHNQTIKCPRCGHESPPSAVYCGMCALHLTKDEMERYARIHENLREIVSMFKKNPKFKNIPDWVMEDALLKSFWKSLVELVNSSKYKEKLKRSGKN